MLEFGYTEAVVHLAWSKGEKNSYNQYVPVYTPNTIQAAVDVPDADETGLEERQLTEITIFLEPGTETMKQDQFVVRGRKYQAQQDGLAVRNAFTGALFPTPVRLRRTDG